jgi:N-acetylmuramoyl-L-alanine amidase
LARPEITGIRHSSQKDKTRVVIDLSSSSHYELSTRSNPERLVLDLPGVRFATSLRPRTVSSAEVKTIRSNKLRRGAQVVLDLQGAQKYKVFSLNAVPGKKPHRIVLDVFPALRGPVRAQKPAPFKERDIVIVLDPGHGGEDPGAIRGKLREKSIVLDIAKRMKKEFSGMSGYRVILTREKDKTLSLGERRRIASRAGGDLLLSIHCNTAPNSRARGQEVFYLSLRGASSRKAQVLADRENRADLAGGVISEGRQSVQLVLDERMKRVLARSYSMANEAHRLARKTPGMKSRGVKRAGLAICKTVDMPSILVETGFLSNSRDRELLGSKQGRQKMANWLVDSVDRYFRKNASSLKDPLFSKRKKLVYRVRKGDNLSSIARRNGVSLKELKEVNGLNSSNRIFPGQRLVVLGDKERKILHQVRKGETLSGIARQYGVSMRKIMRDNRIRSPHLIRVGQKILVKG